ncbi:hypothetical protein, partial [Burkholderia pyrrocinia]|uniref:hypothetical protein n=1 Tax=Burkholderia pyrrocinia TaxID=60550 RepID=UPI001ABB7720
VNRLFFMTSLSPLEAILSSFNWSENSRAGQVALDAFAGVGSTATFDAGGESIVELATPDGAALCADTGIGGSGAATSMTWQALS